MNKKIVLVKTSVMLLSLLLCTSCDRSLDDVDDISGLKTNQNSIEVFDELETNDEMLSLIDKLPQEQQDVELDLQIAQMRKFNKENVELFADGTSISFGNNGTDLLGYSENVPDFSNYSENEKLQITNTVIDYLEKVLKMPKSDIGYDINFCIDPRILAIYDNEDKGVLDGYENENICIYEYETEKEDVYSYLFLARYSKDEDFKVVHAGDSYNIK